MPTTGTVLGKNMLVYTGSTPVAITCQGGFTINLQANTEEAVCKDSGAYTQQIPGRISWSIEVSEALLAFDATNGYTQLMTAFKAATRVDVQVSTGVTGDRRLRGEAYITNLSMEGGVDGPVKYNITFSGYGEPLWELVP
jgi:predicted secreted protein